MKVKTSELTGPALDWAVATAEGDELAAKNIEYPHHAKFYPKISPSTDWSQGGPIIERERIDVLGMVKGESGPWTACLRKKDEAPPWRHITEGPTPLIAAMRCYVASKLGDTVNIPEELQ
jgi:hypothetical protein